MTSPRDRRTTAPRRATSATLTTGALAAAAFFAAAMILEILGADAGDGQMTDVAGVTDGLVALTPWAWATLGVYALVATPVVGLVVTAWEYWSIGDRRTFLLALAVIVVLGAGVVVALLH